MPPVRLTDALRTEYQSLFDHCIIRADRQQAVEQAVAGVLGGRARYAVVEQRTGVPWYGIGCIHSMECGLDFGCHLHNGDPLSARTSHVPAGRPRSGNPPFAWEDSACDALAMRGLGAGTDWSLPSLLFQLEGYNGWGYRQQHPEVRSPYLWSYSTWYDCGKYVADGTWSSTARSKQCGAAVLLRRMAEKGAIQFSDQPAPSDGQPPLVRYARRMPTNSDEVQRAMDLQRWLNTLSGVFVKVDGWAGRATSDAFRRVTGRYLPGDPRGE